MSSIELLAISNVSFVQTYKGPLRQYVKRKQKYPQGNTRDNPQLNT